MAAQITKRLVNASTGKGRVAMITGGVSGLGAATALAFARAGASGIVLTDLARQKAKAEETIKMINSEVPSCKLQFMAHDVTKEPEWEAVISKTHETVGPLDIMVNSAGIGKAHPRLEDITLELWNEMIDINLTGTFLGTKWGIRSMKENKAKESKSIVNLSSIEGIIAEAGATAYNASKGGVRLLTKSTALYCAQARYNIRCNSVHPGYIDTPMLRALYEVLPAEQANDYMVDVIRRHPIGRVGQAREIADAILFLSTEESSFMTGSEVVVDGGYTAQ